MDMYWRLQGRRINRHLRDVGLHPAAGYLLMTMIFAGVSAYIFYRAPYATYLYAFLGLSITTTTAEAGRVAFLKQHFDERVYRKIRLLENSMIIFPFIIVLFFQKEWIVAISLWVLSLMTALMSVERKLHLTLPTPFYRYPFEWTTGFRKNYVLVLIAMFLQVMAVIHQNGNLALFAPGIMLFTGLTFYMQTEPHYLVWIHAMTPARFLGRKIRIAVLYASVWSLPFLIVPAFFFPDLVGYALVLYVLGLSYIVAAVLSKYAFFPAPVNLPQGITLAISFSFPPLLLFLIPYFYRRALHQLKPILT